MKLSHLQPLISIKNKINKKIRQKHKNAWFSSVFSDFLTPIWYNLVAKKIHKGVEKSINNISQISIFEYRKIENLGDLGDLERLKIFFENIDDDKLCEKLEKRRKNGRNDYPVRTIQIRKNEKLNGRCRIW